ncbi:LemA family protein [Paracidovorax sp. MALMAid1276]|uniref:LemA family protein n=1 Tax=Paracidovorax sp. MALMAid1276 TaxID=3411631 RepID=UPI003B9CB644
MWSSPLFWMAFAIVLFWALGAYNRLMRLRSAVVQSFGSFDAHMVRLVALLGEFSAAHAVQRGMQADGTDAELAALQGATTQLSACLAVARARPLSVDAVAALTAARRVLRDTWQSAGRNPASVLTDAPPPQGVWQTRWDEHVQQNEQAARVFNDAVGQYNAAVAQFPANVLARVFGFRPARALEVLQ